MLVQVIHYELPNTSELFVHRSGRTARAGKKGSAILIYTNDQARAVRIIEQDIGCKFTEVKTVPKLCMLNPNHIIFAAEIKICLLIFALPCVASKD